jgi:hypothetical protein
MKNEPGYVALNRFRQKARKMQPTRKHKIVLWENMLGTVVARAADDDVVTYFDYDYERAIKHVGEVTDIRVFRLSHSIQIGDRVLPKGKLVWAAIPAERA